MFDSLLTELFGLTLEEQDRDLTEEEQQRYCELVGILQDNNIEIPFGIEM